MNTLPLRPVLLALCAVGGVLVLAGVVLAVWQPAALGLAALQGAVLLAVLRAPRSPELPKSDGLREAVLRLDERLTAVDVRVVVEAQATQRLIEDLRSDTAPARDH